MYAKSKAAIQSNIREGFYFMEVCDQVQAVTIVLREKEVPFHLYIQPRSITAQSHDGSIRVYPLTLYIEPSSCSGLEYKKEEGLSMRLQIRTTEDTPPAQTPMGAIVERLTNALLRLRNVPCNFGCRGCGISFIDVDVKFTRALSLPSENWEELSTAWTCCTHKASKAAKEGTENLLNNILVPRETEIFVSEFFLHLHPKIILRNNVVLYAPRNNTDKDSTRTTYLFKCARCLTPSGETILKNGQVVEVYKFLKSAVEFRTYYDPFPMPVFHSDLRLERVLAQKFINNVKTMNSYRYILQDDAHKPIMLIKVLSIDSRIRLNQAWCDDPKEGVNRGNSAFGCCGVPQRKLKTEEWVLNNLTLPKKKEPCIRQPKDGPKQFDKMYPIITSIEDVLSDVRASLPTRKAPTVIRGLVPEEVWDLYMFSSNCLTVGRTCEDGSVDDASGLERVVKVMYTSATMNLGKELTPQWAKDTRVQSLTFPHDVCMEAGLVLATATLSLPLTHRVAGDGFLFGMLRVE